MRQGQPRNRAACLLLDGDGNVSEVFLKVQPRLKCNEVVQIVCTRHEAVGWFDCLASQWNKGFILRVMHLWCDQWTALGGPLSKWTALGEFSISDAEPW